MKVQKIWWDQPSLVDHPAASEAAPAAIWRPSSDVSLRAGQAFNFIVSAGQWARLIVEQRLDGEYVTLLSKPLVAVATTAATKARVDRSVSENLT